jgi:hypothetical protein
MHGRVVPVAQAPHGVDHHYAPLGKISGVGDGSIKIEQQLISLLS